jgi:hypothetical protein
MTSVAQFSTSMMIEVARQRLAQMSLPAGADRDRLNGFITGIGNAIGNAIQTWQSQASLVDVTINGPIATGGKLNGPPLQALILARKPASLDEYTVPVSAGVHNAFASFQREVRVPGLPWYPAFAAFPGPIAPPMPNVPAPLMTLCGTAVRFLKEGDIASAVIQKYPRAAPACANEVAKAVAAGLEKALFPWLSGTLVMNVMGGGPIPGFAPPYVPVGPVVNGRGNMPPGGLR